MKPHETAKGKQVFPNGKLKQETGLENLCFKENVHNATSPGLRLARDGFHDGPHSR